MRKDPVQFKLIEILESAKSRPLGYLTDIMAVARVEDYTVWFEWDDFVALKSKYDPDWRSRGVTIKLGEQADCKTCAPAVT